MTTGAAMRLVGFDLTIASDCAVPGAIPVATAGPPDLRIDTAAPLPPDSAPQQLYRWEDGVLTFAAPDVGTYACRLNAITIKPAHGADPEMVTALLIATALPAVMWLRGGAMLHAAGIAPPAGGGAIAIAGPSGIGKSVLAAQLIAEGGALLADDSICLRRNGDHAMGSGLPGGYHRATGVDQREFRPVPQTVRVAPIRAVIVLSTDPGAADLVRLDPVDALATLLTNAHRPRVPEALGTRPAMLAAFAFVANRCPVYRWHRPAEPLTATERAMLTREGLW